MVNLLTWGISAFVGVSLVAFGFSLVSLFRLPSGERPRTPTFDRFGNEIAVEENPDYHINPGEEAEVGKGTTTE